MNRRAVWAGGGIASLFGVVGVGSHHLFNALNVGGPDQSLYVKVILQCVPPVLATAIGALVTPVRERILDWVAAGAFDKRVCNIYLFGTFGSGKTTLIKAFLSMGGIPEKEKTTPSYQFYSNKISLDPNGRRQVRIEIADYQGQKPSMVVTDLPEDFAGPKGNRRINAILFVVDPVPRVAKEDSSEPLDDEETLKWLASDTDSKIKKRIDQHRDYFSKSTLEMVFSAVYSKRLSSVRLLINKVDLMRRACEKGYLVGVDQRNLDDYIRRLFTDIEDNLKAACSANDIEDFAVRLVSVKHDVGTRDLFAKIVQKYSGD